MKKLRQKDVDAAGRMLIDRGLIVAAGFEGYKLMFPQPLDPGQLARERRAFFAGAQHLFASIMNSGLDENAEPTDADLRRMGNIARELKEFEEQMLRESSH